MESLPSRCQTTQSNTQLPCDSSSLSKPLQSQIGQDDSASISYNGSEELSTSSPHTSEKVNVGQKQLQYQGVEEDVGEEKRNFARRTAI
jgi:hypothetical protein